MTLTPKFLANGQVASSKGTIYTVPASTTTMFTSMTFYNTSATTQTVIVYLKASGGTSREIGRAVLEQYEMLEIEKGKALEASGVVEAETTTASVVNYTVCGVEET